MITSSFPVLQFRPGNYTPESEYFSNLMELASAFPDGNSSSALLSIRGKRHQYVAVPKFGLIICTESNSVDRIRVLEVDDAQQEIHELTYNKMIDADFAILGDGSILNRQEILEAFT